MSEIPYSTVEEQIKKLESKHLIIADKSFAYEMLTQYGYYNIINTYKEPYTHTEDGKEYFNDGITFEQIYSLFVFDHNIRNNIMASMLSLEEILKASVSEILSNAFGTHPDDYLQIQNFSDRNCKRRFRLRPMLDKFKNTIQTTDKEPIKHYRDDRNCVPPWILMKDVFLTDLVNFIKLFRSNEKEALVKRLYTNADKLDNLEFLKNLLSDTLAICNEFRNLAAHGARIYNYQPASNMRIDNERIEVLKEILPNISSLACTHGIAQLTLTLDFFKYSEPYETLYNAITYEINRHLTSYPQDMQLLSDIMGVVIEHVPIAWFKEGAKCYHSTPHCSNLRNPCTMPISEIEAKGYIKCKRCFPI